MRSILKLMVAVLISAVITQPQIYGRESVKPMDNNVHIAWLSDRIKEAKSIKPGMSRRALLKVFDVEAGLQSMLPTRYCLRSCPLMKVDVTFDGAGKHVPAKRPVQDDADLTILTVSPIYVDYSIVD